MPRRGTRTRRTRTSRRSSSRRRPRIGYTRDTGLVPYTAAVSRFKPELKFKDSTVADPSMLPTNIPSVSTGARFISSVVALTQGASGSQRIGRKVNVKSLLIRGAIELPAKDFSSGTSWLASTNRVRLVVVLDRQCNATAAAWSDVFDTQAANNSQVDAQRKMENSKRFRILCDKILAFTSPAMISNGANLRSMGTKKTIKKYIKFPKGVPVTYSTTSADPPTVAEVITNNILVFLIADSNNSTGGNNDDYTRLESLTCRMRYQD